MEREEGNEHDRYAVAVRKDGRVIGHVPRGSMSKISWFFLRRGGNITCKISGKRKRGHGLEVPCFYIYHCGSSKMVSKLKKLLA